METSLAVFSEKGFKTESGTYKVPEKAAEVGLQEATTGAVEFQNLLPRLQSSPSQHPGSWAWTLGCRVGLSPLPLDTHKARDLMLLQRDISKPEPAGQTRK